MSKVIRTEKVITKALKVAVSHDPNDLRPLRPVDYQKSWWLVRWIDRFFNWLGRIFDTAMKASPVYQTHVAELGEIDRVLKERTDKLRLKYPERYAIADREMKDKYDYLNELNRE